MSERSWTELVKAGREAAQKFSSASFVLGDLALEVEPMGDRGVRTGSLERLEQFADEIGVGYGILIACRSVAACWPPEQREPSLSWTAHKLLMGAPDRLQALQEVLTSPPPPGGPLSEERWTIRSIRELVRRKRAEAGLNSQRSAPRTPQPKAEGPVRGRADAIVTLENVSLAATNFRAWVFGAELGRDEKSDLAQRLDEALGALREARKRLV